MLMSHVNKVYPDSLGCSKVMEPWKTFVDPIKIQANIIKKRGKHQVFIDI